ncbi:MAG: hypothetical protein TIS_02920 [Tissierella sp.]
MAINFGITLGALHAKSIDKQTASFAWRLDVAL